MHSLPEHVHAHVHALQASVGVGASEDDRGARAGCARRHAAVELTHTHDGACGPPTPPDLAPSCVPPAHRTLGPSLRVTGSAGSLVAAWLLEPAVYSTCVLAVGIGGRLACPRTAADLGPLFVIYEEVEDERDRHMPQRCRPGFCSSREPRLAPLCFFGTDGPSGSGVPSAKDRCCKPLL